MGIRELTSVINEHAPSAIEEKDIKDYFGKIIAVDVSMSLHQFLSGYREQDGSPLRNVYGKITSHLRGIFDRTVYMVENGIKPLYVFDGQAPQLKSNERAKREARREEAARELEEAIQAGNTERIATLTRQLVRVTREREDECKKLLKLMGIPFIDAPGEAEAQCAALVKAGKVYATATEDMDALPFGSKVLLTQLKCSNTKVKEFRLDQILAGFEMTYDQFVDLCILLGCDYCGTIRQIGPKRAYNLITHHKSIEKIIMAIDTRVFSPPACWPIEEVRKLFTEPEVLKPSYIEFSWTAPDEQGLINYMVEENGFNEESIKRGVAKLKKVLSDATLRRQHNAGGIISFDRHYDIPVEVSGSRSDNAFWRDFSDANLPSQLMKNLQTAGRDKPTPIQRHAMRWISLGRDLMACAETGSGKTLAFLLPILSAMMKSPNQALMFAPTGGMQEPIALIVEPTRELALQIMDEAQRLGVGTGAKLAVAYGGVPKASQQEVIQRGCNILVATPGRLIDFIKSGIIGLSKCKFLVLDEADRMLDKGLEKNGVKDDECFKEQMKELVEHCGLTTPYDMNRRQTLMFSATFPLEIQLLASEPYFLYDHIFIKVGEVGSANIDITQEILLIPQSEKMDKLMQLLKADMEAFKNDDGTYSKMTLVFVERKYDTAMVARFINASGLPTTAIHRPLEQVVRERNLGDFRLGHYPVLVATSVAARGLHIEGVDHVINFDMPLSIEDYVHRIGRTGRMGKPGRSTSFFDPEKDSGVARDVLKIMTKANQRIPRWFEVQCEKLGGGATTNFVDVEE